MITFYSWPILGQKYLTNVQFYNDENGLAGLYANCTFEDSRGLVWIGTQFGLHRFDGEEFMIFDESTGLPFPQVMEIHEDDQGWLWLYRNCYHKPGCVRDLTFMHSISHEQKSFEEWFESKVNLRPEQITSIITAADGSIFFSADKKIFRWSTGQLTTLDKLPDLPHTPKLITQPNADQLLGWYNDSDPQGNNFIQCITVDSLGNIKQLQDLSTLNPEAHFNSLRFMGKDFKGEQFFEVVTEPLQNSCLLALKDDGLFIVDTSAWSEFLVDTKLFEQLYFNPYSPLAWHYDPLKAFHFSDGLAADFGRVFPELDRTLFLRHTRFDQNNLVWLCGRYGVFRIEFKPNPFRRVLYEPESNWDQGHKYICQSVVDLENGEYLLSTQKGVFVKKESPDLAPVPIADLIPYASPRILSIGFEHDVWGVNDNLLFRIKRENSKSTKKRLELIHIDPRHGLKEVFGQHYQDSKLWLGTTHGITVYDHLQKTFSAWDKYNGFDELENLTIREIRPIDEDKWWLCTDNGLYLFSPEQGVIAHHANEKHQLPAVSVKDIQRAKAGGWWVATEEGLFYWYPDKTRVEHFTVADGLPANEVLAVHEDNYGFLWLATNQGLVQWDIEKQKAKIYLEADGICTRDFENHSYLVQKDGTVWMGSTDGYTIFHPKDFKDLDVDEQPDIPLNILFYEQFSNETDKLEVRTVSLLREQEIILHPGEHFFNLQVALADYVKGENASYAYRIEGYQDFWQEGAENNIRISGLPYGTYLLKIKGKLSDGQYSSREIHLPIQVLRPFYLTTWFLIVMVVSLLGGAVFYFKWRLHLLRKRQAKLEDTVRIRTEIINQQKIELSQLERLKSRFFANVSHELRTPLTLIIGPLQSLLKKAQRPKNERNLLEMATKNSQELLRLVNEILDLSKLETGQLKIKEETVNLYEFLQLTISHFSSFGDDEGIEVQFDFQLDQDTNILIDKEKFKKITHNFLSNALKFTPPNGQVTLCVESFVDYLQLSVKDSGRGIHPEDLPYIFDRFYQSKQPDAKLEGGTGIGLALCKELAELLNGRIWAESELGLGSTFYFQFDNKKALVQPDDISLSKTSVTKPELITEVATKEEGVLKKTVAKSSTVHPSVKGSTILVVEDNPQLRQFLEFLLSDYKAMTAENGQDALEQLEAIKQPAKVDLIISDLMMPVMDGFQLLEKLKSEDRWRHLPTLMLTAKVNARAKLKALRIGVDDYLNKPFQEEELKARIENLLRNHRERMEHYISQNHNEGKQVDSTLKSKPVMAKVDAEWLEKAEKAFSAVLTDGSLNLSWISTKLHLSQRQLQRRIQQLTGLSPSQYLHEMRMTQAYDFLIQGKYATVKEVSYAVGVRDAKYFSKRFQERFGVLPSTFR